MSDSTSEHQLPANGFVPSPFWADPVPAPPTSADSALDASVPSDIPALSAEVAEAVARGDAALTGALRDLLGSIPLQRAPQPAESTPAERAEPAPFYGEWEPTDASDGDDLPLLDGEESSAGDPAGDAPLAPTDADESADSDATDDEHEDAEEADEDDEVSDEAAARRTRFAELVEERVRRARYAHHLTRAIFTPGEAATAVIVEKRAAIWVPTLTFVATLVSAASAVVLATRLHGDPADPTGHQLLIVMITVCLLAAAFGILLRAEVHYERLRPRGRTVRHDVADAYEIVRDAPRRLVRVDAPLDVLRGVSDLLPAAEQMVDALVEYAAEGGSRVREHPAYERILRMRAEVEALEVILAERAERDLEEELGRKPRTSDVRMVSTDGAPLPRPEQVPNFAGLADLAATLDPPD
ncbi:hypothetical protein [Nocardioides nematodiphilus]|uniref:hypothetical protein n=1 Tax=Nocardioides nematodiphilus TaxID=2849669 RepID=UPI001CDA17FB|nr:hypothetical protein [Nocardioides nematodiphilus]MCA1983702.1 hypothetical protein [Nocardioides nematodiphilus]